MPPVKKIAPARRPRAKTTPQAPLKTKAKPAAAVKIKKLSPAKKVEVLRPIRPKKVPQAIQVEVAEDNFSGSVFDDLVDKDTDYNLPPAEAASVGSKIAPGEILESLPPLDKKQKFFQALSAEIKVSHNHGPAGSENYIESGQLAAPEILDNEASLKNFKKSSGLYRRLVIKFVLAVAVLVLVVAYFSFSKLTLLITPKTENVDTSWEFNVYSLDSGFDKEKATGTLALLTGQIKEITVSGTKSYPANGEDILGEEINGTVKLVNNYNKDQALVAKTRLLSPDNKLYRLKTAVNIPAGEEVSAAIYADEPSPDLAIAPTHFTIPGLWAGLQTKIYAVSESSFVFQNQIKKYIKPSDLELAAQDMNNYLIAQAQNQGNNDFSSDQVVVYKTDESKATSTVDAKAGEVKDQFTISSSGQVTLVAFSKNQAADLVKAQLGLSVSDDKALISLDKEEIVYVLESYDPATKLATIKAEARGLMSLKKDSEVIDRTKLVNLSRDQIKEYLNNFPEIAAYELKFFPSFINKAPGLVDRIKIQISAPKE